MKYSWTSPLLLSVGTLLGACGVLEPETKCQMILRPAIVVEVRDARTDAPSAGGATLVVRDGAYADSAQGAPATGSDASLLISAAPGRPGTYDVLVRKAGFRDWTAENVKAREGKCGVETTRLVARLVSVP